LQVGVVHHRRIMAEPSDQRIIPAYVNIVANPWFFH
jgi:hypothetical protein